MNLSVRHVYGGCNRFMIHKKSAPWGAFVIHDLGSDFEVRNDLLFTAHDARQNHCVARN